MLSESNIDSLCSLQFFVVTLFGLILHTTGKSGYFGKLEECRGIALIVLIPPVVMAVGCLQIGKRGGLLSAGLLVKLVGGTSPVRFI